MPSANGQFQSQHGHTSSRGGKTYMSPTYYSWMKMKDRVLNPNHVHYDKYGGAGVTICEQWMLFENFLTDVGVRPEGKTLDRYPDSNGNYTPDNVRWATRKQQARNRQNNRLLTYNNITKTAVEWAEESPVSKGTFMGRLRLGWPIEKIMVTTLVPNGRRNRNASGKFA